MSHAKRKLLAGVVSAALVACGGGGGSGGTAGSGPGVSVDEQAPGPFAITRDNAKALTADALANASDVRLARALSFVLLHVVSGGVSWNVKQPPTPSESSWSNLYTESTTPVEVFTTYPCSLGGTVSVDRTTVTNWRPIRWGDTLSVRVDGCRDLIEGVDTTLQGAFQADVTQGIAWSTGTWNPSVAFSLVFSGFSMVEDQQVTTVASGDMAIAASESYGPLPCWTCDPTLAASIATITGTELRQTRSQGSSSRTFTLRNYSQQVTYTPHTVYADATTSGVLANGAIVTVNPRLAPWPVAYTLASLRSLVTSNGDLVEGTLEVSAANGFLRATLPSWNNLDLQVDTNGDGIVDATLATTPAELATLMPQPE